MSFRSVLLATTILVLSMESGIAKDYLLTIGGGFAPQGNQASLEANVLFYQQLVQEKTTGSVEHKIFFADGFDAKEDLQVVAPKLVAKSPAFELLQSVFDLNRDRVEYRNHQVPDIHGSISPFEVREGISQWKDQLSEGDRLIVYVTAHGGAATGKNKMDTSIACWNKKPLRMTSFAKWLDEIPDTVPVILVMAQCYCGGFVNTMFAGGDPDAGLANANRVGFFAQRHDLPAAGCRPDIENDEEYSSYFWGAFLGRSRSGRAIANADCNGDGHVSFIEAHTYAVLESPTIDIPLATSEEFLRRYSRIAEYAALPLGVAGTEDASVVGDDKDNNDVASLAYLAGTISEVANLGSPELRRCVLGLAEQLQLPTSEPSTRVFALKKEQEEEFRRSKQRPSRGGPRGPRSSRRRDFREELITKWPELSDPANWNDLAWLQANECEPFLKEVRELSNFEPFQQSMAERTLNRERSTAAELKLVRFRRLIYAMETIVLAKNLTKVASPELLQKYDSIRKLEESFF